MRIRNKLTFRFLLIVAGILFLFSASIYYFSAQFREHEFKSRMIEKGLTTAHLLIKVDEVGIKLLSIIDRNNLTALENEKVTIYNDKNVKLYTSDDDPEIPVSTDIFKKIRKDKEVNFKDGNIEVMGLLYKEKGQSYTVIVSAYDKDGIIKLKNLRIILITGFVFSVLITSVSGWVFAGQALKPISRIINEVTTITASRLNTRVDEGNGTDEIALLAITFNKVLERLERAFQVQKSFVSHASHELRTPLSTIRSQLDFISLQDRNLDDYKKLIASVKEDITSIIKLSNGLLSLAQVETDALSATFNTIRIDELIYQTISDIKKKYSSQKINLNIDETLESDESFLITGRESLLKTAFYNIIDNACKYSNRMPVDISIALLKDHVLIKVTDLGMGIPKEDLRNIFMPFFRGKNIRTIQGHGIGLSLSERIIKQHKGHLKLHSEINRGTTVEIYLTRLSAF